MTDPRRACGAYPSTRRPRRSATAGAAAAAGLIAAALGAGGAPALAQDRADLDRTQIIGNRELPKVLYIVPWKKPQAGAASGRPARSVLDEVLAPVDRDVMRRQIHYDAQLRPPPEAAAGKP